MLKIEVYACVYCGTRSIHVGTETGSSYTECPNGCPGNFALVPSIELATWPEGIDAALRECGWQREET